MTFDTVFAKTWSTIYWLAKNQNLNEIQIIEILLKYKPGRHVGVFNKCYIQNSNLA